MKKHIFLSGLVCSFVSLNSFSYSFAGPFDFANPPAQKEEKKSGEVDLNSLNVSAQSLVIKVGTATGVFAKSAILVLSALGMKEESVKLQLAQEELAKKPDDPEKVKKLVEASSQAFEALNKVKFGANTKLQMSVEELGNAFISLMAGIVLDGGAVKDAGQLLQDASNSVSLVAANPFKYGMSAVGTVNSIVDSSKFVVDNVPKQVKSVQEFTDKLISYFKTNKIEVPSPEKIQQMTKKLMKG